MKNNYNTPQCGSFRKWVSQIFASLTKSKDCNYLKAILEKLQDIEDSIDLVAREIARQIKRREQ